MLRAGVRGADGITLIELMIALAIVAILTALTAAGVDSLTTRAAAGNFVGELALEVYNLRMEAARRGCSMALVVNFEPGADRTRNGFTVFSECGSGALNLDDLADFPPSSPPAGVAQRRFVPMGRALLPDEARGTTSPAFPFKGPFESVPADSRSCSFCKRYDSGAIRGGLRVLSDGRLSFGETGANPGPNQAGGGTLVASAPTDDGLRNQMVIILSPSGMTRIFPQ